MKADDRDDLAREDSRQVDRRRHRRSVVENIYTTIEVGGEQVRARVSDLSEGGMKISMPRHRLVPGQHTIRIAIDEVSPTLVGTVRWSAEDPANAGRCLVGVQFESLVIREVVRDEATGEVDLAMPSRCPNSTTT